MFQPRYWPVIVRFDVVLLGGVAAFIAPFLVARSVGLAVTPAGCANALIVALMGGWLVADGLFSRRGLYEALGSDELVLRPGWRFWRKVTLLACATVALASAALAAASPKPGQIFPPGALQTLGVLMSAALAAFGWMYTTFEKDKADRAKNSLDAVREQLTGTHMLDLIRKAERLLALADMNGAPGRKTPLPREYMATKAERTAAEPQSRPLSDVVDDLLSACDQLAFGVRQGHLDFTTVEMVLRARFLRWAFRFGPYIAAETNAQNDEAIGQYRSQRSTWEHFLWLVSKLEIHPGDNVRRGDLVAPPRMRDILSKQKENAAVQAQS